MEIVQHLSLKPAILGEIMSPFNQCLEICENEDAIKYFRLIYWSRNSKNRDAREKRRIAACDLRESISEDNIIRAHSAMTLWNRLKPKSRLRIPQRTSMDHLYGSLKND